MRDLKLRIKRFVQDEKGLETVEYAIIAALVAGTAIVAITSVGTSVAARFDALVTALQ